LFAVALSFAVSVVAAVGLWIMGPGGPGSVLHPFMFLAALGLFAFRPLRRALGTDATGLAPCLPVLVPFVQGGAAGFALAALLAGLGVLLAGPCLERLSAGRRAPGRGSRGALAARRLVSLALLVSYAAVAFFSPFPLAFCLAAPAFFLIAYFASLWASLVGASGGGSRGRRRFSPVRMIVNRRAFELGFAWAMFPFALAALVSAFLGFLSIVDLRDGGGGLFAALAPLLFILPAFVLWGSAGKQEGYAEAAVAFFSRDAERGKKARTVRIA